MVVAMICLFLFFFGLILIPTLVWLLIIGSVAILIPARKLLSFFWLVCKLAAWSVEPIWAYARVYSAD